MTSMMLTIEGPRMGTTAMMMIRVGNDRNRSVSRMIDASTGPRK